MMRVATDRVCIVMMSAVGDTVHVLPVLHALKRANPAMQVTWILQPGPAMLVRGHAWIWRAGQEKERLETGKEIVPYPEAKNG